MLSCIAGGFVEINMFARKQRSCDKEQLGHKGPREEKSENIAALPPKHAKTKLPAMQSIPHNALMSDDLPLSLPVTPLGKCRGGRKVYTGIFVSL